MLHVPIIKSETTKSLLSDCFALFKLIKNEYTKNRGKSSAKTPHLWPTSEGACDARETVVDRASRPLEIVAVVETGLQAGSTAVGVFVVAASAAALAVAAKFSCTRSRRSLSA